MSALIDDDPFAMTATNESEPRGCPDEIQGLREEVRQLQDSLRSLTNEHGLLARRNRELASQLNIEIAECNRLRRLTASPRS